MRVLLSSLVLFTAIITSCSVHKTINTQNTYLETNEDILLGHVDESELKNNPVFNKTEDYYNSYNVDEKLARIIQEKSDDINIIAVFGSWCGDSKVNIPVFRKIIDKSNFNKSKVKYIAVDRRKKGGNVNVSALNIEYVPTFIFIRNNKEIGRIVENPINKTIEEDWVEIISASDLK